MVPLANIITWLIPVTVVFALIACIFNGIVSIASTDWFEAACMFCFAFLIMILYCIIGMPAIYLVKSMIESGGIV